MTPTDQLAHALPKDPAKDSLEQAEIRAALAAAGLDHERAAEAFQALALRIWSDDSPLGCGDVHTIADLDQWVANLPEDEAAAFNAMLGEGFARRLAWDGDHPVSEWTRRNEDADPDGGA